MAAPMAAPMAAIGAIFPLLMAVVSADVVCQYRRVKDKAFSGFNAAGLAESKQSV